MSLPVSSPELLRVGAASGVAALGALMNTAIGDHRSEDGGTHRSVRVKEPYAQIGRIIGSPFTDRRRWASVHTVHHNTPDVNLLRFLEIADYMSWHVGQTLSHEGQIDIPDTIEGIDPALGAVSIDFVQEVGEEARELVSGMYTPPDNYSSAEARALLLGTAPSYFYESAEEMKRRQKNPIPFDPDNNSAHDIRFLLRDPHSPALHKDGILGILRDNVKLYNYVEQQFGDPRFRHEHLQPDEMEEFIRENRAKLRLAFVGGMMLAGTLVNRRYAESNLDTFIHAAMGAAGSGAATGLLIVGGNITNSFGHGGDLRRLTWEDFKNGVVHPLPNGRYTNNKKSLSAVTLDEVGGQYEHHEDPRSIAYSFEEGLERWKDAPFGSVLEAFVSKGWILERGDNFGIDGLEGRPDMPTAAVLMIEEERRRQYPDLFAAA